MIWLFTRDVFSLTGWHSESNTVNSRSSGVQWQRRPWWGSVPGRGLWVEALGWPGGSTLIPSWNRMASLPWARMWPRSPGGLLGLHLRWIERDHQPSDFHVGQVIVLWGSFDGHPHLIRITDSVEILKSYWNIWITFKFILIIQLSYGKILKTFDLR